MNGGGLGGQLAAAGLLAAAVFVLPPQSTSSRLRLCLVASRCADRSSDRWFGRWFGRPEVVLPAVCGLAMASLAAVLVGGTAGLATGSVVGGLAAVGARRWIREPAYRPTEPLRLAGGWDLLAACLRAGLPVSTATRAVADQLPGSDGEVLRKVAELLAIGADPADAWQPALAPPSTAPLARAARRTAHSGAAMAKAVADLASQVRASAADRAEERAQRAGVLITGPLGLCFLPAFFCLGVLPVIVGLAGQLIEHW